MRHFSILQRLISCTAVLLLLLTTPACADDFWSWEEPVEEEEAAALDDIPNYWMDELSAGAKEINQALLDAGRNKSAFLFYSDSHWNFNSQKSPILLKYLYDHTGMNKTIFGGDIVYNESEDYDAMAYLWAWRSMVKELPNHHSVVGNHDDGNATNNLFDADFVYGYLLAAEETPDMVWGEGDFYYYIDSPAEKTRYLYLDTAYQTILYDPAQTQFLIDALKTLPANWHAVIIAHIWYVPDYDQEINPEVTLSYGGEMILSILDDYNERKTGSLKVAERTDMENPIQLNYDFTDCVGKVEFCIGGHTHCDFDAYSESGIPIILVETDSYNVRSGLECEEFSTSESSVNGIIADYDAKKITVVRVGRGESRVVPIK